MKSYKVKNLVLCAVMALVGFISCSDDEKDKNVAVTGVSVSPPTLSLVVGMTGEPLTATVLPENATTKTVSWNSSATNVASVDDNGKVTAIAVGTATITVRTLDGNKTAECAVTVSARAIPATALELDRTAITLMVNDEATLTATPTPVDATGQVTWSSSNPAVVTVNTNGRIMAKTTGEAIITAAVEADRVEAKCAVTVIAAGAQTLMLIGYTDGNVVITYTDGEAITAAQADGANFLFDKNALKTIGSITIGGGAPIPIGRTANENMTFKIEDGAIAFRNAADGFIPIGSYAEFQLIVVGTDAETMLQASYKQEADLDLMEKAWMPIGAFSGVFDGGGFELKNLKIQEYGISERGLFSQNLGTLRNIKLVSGSVAGAEVIGSICAYNNGGTINNCSNTGCIISGTHHVGGICGHNSNNGTIRNSYSTAGVSVDQWNAGGICGFNNGGNLIACYNTGNVVNGAAITGGVCGTNTGKVVACYNTGSVTGSQYSNGGVCGLQQGNGTLTACYSTGQLQGGWDNGYVCGRNISGTVTGCYYKSGTGNASAGIGGLGTADGGNPATITPTDENALPFTVSQWPSADVSAAWGTGNGSAENTYWKSLGSYSGKYPQLWFE